jgi:phosphoribosylaminoimidazole-succinocarboxamide synthase
MVVKKAKPLPVECIVRGYLSGSGWSEYREKGSISSIVLPAGLRESQKLETALFTPSTKAEAGVHDENIDFPSLVKRLGKKLAEDVQALSIRIYKQASALAEERGIIIADTKFEFGLDKDSRLLLIDEALTPDSSRFWPRDVYAPGGPQISFDKQFVRDYLLSIRWDKKPPAPTLPEEVIRKTSEKYMEAYERLTGEVLE